MAFSKILDGIYIQMISDGGVGQEITESEYNELLSVIHARPIPPSGYDYRLRADTLEWELVELPPEPVDPDVDDAEALNILLGGGEV